MAPDLPRARSFVRAALVLAIAAGALIDDRPGLYQPAFYVLLAVAAAYSGLLVLVPRLRRRPAYVYAVIDLALLAGLAHNSGGAYSEVRFAFFAIPVLAAMAATPLVTAGVSAAVGATYLTLALTQPAQYSGGNERLVFVELVYLGWTAAAAVVLSGVLTRHADAIRELARARGLLMAEMLEAEDQERRRIANWLHDDAVQNLIVVEQDLHDVERGDRAALARAREVLRATVAQLRSGLADLFPGAMPAVGLVPALEVLCEAHARRAGFDADLTVEPAAAGVYDELLLSVARELLINVAKHAGAEHVELSVRRRGDELIVLEIADDGRGFDVAARRADALAHGHIGLASSVERVERLGGRLTIDSRPGHGTRGRVELPLPPD
jgi:two-component system, NarL family, sensor kinase